MRAAQTMPDPHVELGVAPGATEREIKEAYRRLAARWHPDRNSHPRAAEHMARINQAYQQILREAPGSPRPARAGGRAAAEDAPKPPSAPPSAPPAPPPSAPPRASAAEEARAAARKPRPWWERDWSGARWEADGPPLAPRTLRHTAQLTLEQAAFGCTHEIEGEVADACPCCHGSGRLRATRTDCRRCHGQGRVRADTAGRPRGTSRGAASESPGASLQDCPDCGGDGAERKPCEACGGSGLDATPRRYHFEVRMPAGLREGQSVKLRGQGQRCGSQAGDIELSVALLPHAFFHFDDQQRLACRVPVDWYAQLGEGTATVPALDGGSFELDLAGCGPGCPPQPVAGRGYPQRDGQRGPLVVHLETVLPEAHTATQRQLLRQLAEDRRADGYRHSPALAQWQARLARRSSSG